MPTRLLRTGICSSETINALSAEAEVFFYRLLVVADDFGLMDARLPILKAACFPLKEVSDHSLKKWLEDLRFAPLITVYEVEGRRYLSILKWDKFQRIRNVDPKYPPPTHDKARTIDRNSRTSSGDMQQNAARASDTDSSASSAHARSNGRAKSGEIFELPAWVPKEPWAGYVEMRVKMRKPMTERAKALAVAKLDTLRGQGHDPEALLNEATEKCWQGIYPPKAGPPPKSDAKRFVS